ncbi:hypothetical protein MARPU_11290 [Marichromatium purpuratum 984]|uniref:Type I-U CRISPR-associated protein Cas5/Cas6 n=1 Tax=Marichromatium purpuratum 984 TaxID=765910 RepID=W0E915_MARPU|nr:type I-U CRISPR-associated protein Csb2 [Marichromatium purpuratum]AHF05556.1 hypothetical protein MARPU_11290 [Marichromatium purpuratum 984]
MLTLQMDLLNGCYHAADPMAPSEPEWPLAVDRTFQGLVAGAYESGQDPAPLRALEGVAPELRFGPARRARHGTLYVPAAYKAKQTRVAKYDPCMVEIRDPVVMCWPGVPAELRAPIAAIAAEVDYLGRAKSPVSCTVLDEPPELPRRLVPDADGDRFLRVPQQGRLDELDAAFEAGLRAPIAPLVAYADSRVRRRPSPWGELLVLRPGRELSIRRAARLAAALRAAVLSIAGDDASPLLHGHDGAHAAWCVLPHVGHRHARGQVLGLGLWLPRGIDEDARAQCALALAGVRHLQVDGMRVELSRQPAHRPPPAGLHRATWARAATRWASVTPVVLDRHPKKGEAVERLIADSVEMAGYPRPIEVRVGQQGPFIGVPVARDFRPRGRHRWMHVALGFDRAVAGPLLIGRERHFGMGLMRPEDGA